MAIDGMKVIDLDSHLVGDLESWEQTIEDQWRPYLPQKLPTKDNERRKTLVGNRIMIGSELGRQKAEKKEWVTPTDLTPVPGQPGVTVRAEDLRDRVAPHPSQPYCPE